MVETCQSFGQLEKFLKKDEIFEKPSPKERKISFGVLNYSALDVVVRPPLLRSQSKPIFPVGKSEIRDLTEKKLTLFFINFCTNFDPLNYFYVRRTSYHLKT